MDQDISNKDTVMDCTIEIENEDEEKSTKIDRVKLLAEIRNFRNHFSKKAFFIALLFGLLPSGWDTFSDFAFARDDHSRTIERANSTNLKNFDKWILTGGTIGSVTYLVICFPSIMTISRWILNHDFTKNCKKFPPGARGTAIKVLVVLYAITGLMMLLDLDSRIESSPIFFSLAIISAAVVIGLKILAVFVHGPEMKKLSLRATMAESCMESTFQLIFVGLMSLWSREASTTGLVSMVSSIVMIGKAGAESYLTFGSRNELEGVSLPKHICLLATTSLVFIATAVFRVGSLALITAWNWQLGILIVLPLAAVIFLVTLANLNRFSKFCCRPKSEDQQTRNNYLQNVSVGDMFSSYFNELSTTSNWGNLGREKSQKLQLDIAFFHLLVYTTFLLPIIVSPSTIWFNPIQVYYPDPAHLRVGGIIAISSGVFAIYLQMLLPKILHLQTQSRN